MPAKAVKERPIDFDAESVRAILSGAKTQTRLVITDRAVLDSLNEVGSWDGPGDEDEWIRSRCPYPVGTRLVVKEPFRVLSFGGGVAEIIYDADGARRIVSSVGMPNTLRRVNPRYFPKSARRLWLEVVNVRVERVQEIAFEDMLRDGIFSHEFAYLSDDWEPGRGRFANTEDELADDLHDELRWRFARRWDSINAHRPDCSWSDNPWVFVIEFKRVER